MLRRYDKISAYPHPSDFTAGPGLTYQSHIYLLKASIKVNQQAIIDEFRRSRDESRPANVKHLSAAIRRAKETLSALQTKLFAGGRIEVPNARQR